MTTASSSSTRAWGILPLLVTACFGSLALLMTSAGCSTPGRAGQARIEAHPILKMLTVPDRNTVRLALWTLEQHGILFAQQIDFDKPYSEARPKILAILDQLQSLPDNKLTILDRSLAYHTSIYTPAWKENGWP